jgi:hypothetical protein
MMYLLYDIDREREQRERTERKLVTVLGRSLSFYYFMVPLGVL